MSGQTDKARPSKVPSWIMLGFVLGVLTVLTFQNDGLTRGPAAAQRPDTAAGPKSGASPAPSLSARPSASQAAAAGSTAAPATVPPIGGASSSPPLDQVEALFAVWGHHAVWKNEMTEVALWNRSTHDFSDCFEVIRLGDALYFRSIARLSRPVLNHGVEVESPLEFTDTEEGRAQWLAEAHRETWKAFAESAHESLSGSTSSNVPAPPQPSGPVH